MCTLIMLYFNVYFDNIENKIDNVQTRVDNVDNDGNVQNKIDKFD